MEEPYEALCDTDPSWQLEITVNSSSAWFPLTNSQCCNVKWSVPQTREQRRCSLTPHWLHLKAPILQLWRLQSSHQPSSSHSVRFHHVNFQLMAPVASFTVTSLHWGCGCGWLMFFFSPCFLIGISQRPSGGGWKGLPGWVLHPNLWGWTFLFNYC